MKNPFGITPARRAECERIREGYKTLIEPVWTEGEPDHWSGDYGDYTAGVFPIEAFELTNGMIVPRVIHWSVSKKIVNEWFGPGGLHVNYGDANSIDLAKVFCTQAVVTHRAQALLRLPKPHNP